MRNSDVRDKKTLICVSSNTVKTASPVRRDEEFYRAVLMQKLLLRDKSFSYTKAFWQLHVVESIADLVMINGHGAVYEIKSDLDSFERLNSQINDYFKVFSYVNIVIPESRIECASRELSSMGDFGEHVGIHVLTKRGALHCVRKSRKYDASLESNALIRMLRKPEYTSVLEREGMRIPDSRLASYYVECCELFQKIPLDRAQWDVMAQLKLRNRKTRNDLPESPVREQVRAYFA